jgi:Tfp pilus assembly protein PilV
VDVKFWKQVLTPAGFSLPEIMIGGGILAAVALGSAQLFKEQKKSQKGIEHDQKITMYHQNLAKLMSDVAVCNATMKSVLPLPAAVNSGLLINTIYSCIGLLCADNNSTTDKSFDAYTTNAYTPGDPLIRVGDYVDGRLNSGANTTMTWRLTRMEIIDNRTVTGPVRLRFTYLLQAGGLNKSISKDMFLNFRFFGGQFRECLSPSESNINNLQNDLCKSLNMDELSSSGQTATWNEEKQTCEVVATRTCNPNDGYQVDGIGSDGQIRCKKITTTEDAQRLEDNTQEACASGQAPVVVFEGGKFRVKCQ